MIEKIRPVNNPLTIVAIFAALAEIAGTIALGIVSSELQSIFIWFVMLFPAFIVTLFFLTLNFNAKVLYAPKDFQDEKNFMGLNNTPKQDPKIELEKLNNAIEETKKEMLDLVAGNKPIINEVAINELLDKKLSPRGNVGMQMGRYFLAEEHERLRKDAGLTLSDLFKQE